MLYSFSESLTVQVRSDFSGSLTVSVDVVVLIPASGAREGEKVTPTGCIFHQKRDSWSGHAVVDPVGQHRGHRSQGPSHLPAAARLVRAGGLARRRAHGGVALGGAPAGNLRL